MACPALDAKLPDFTADSQVGMIGAHDFLAHSWSVVFSVNGDFDAVATTELGMVSKLFREFVARDVKLLCISAAGVERHEAWLRDVEETQECKVKFPILADESGALLGKLGMRKSGDGEVGHAMSALVVCDPTLTVRFSMVYSNAVGRNFYEVLRVIDSLQLTEYYKVATPAHWTAGDAVFVLPEVTDEAARELFPKGTTEISMGEDHPPCRQTPYPDVHIDAAVRE